MPGQPPKPTERGKCKKFNYRSAPARPPAAIYRLTITSTPRAAGRLSWGGGLRGVIKPGWELGEYVGDDPPEMQFYRAPRPPVLPPAPPARPPTRLARPS
eukprot:SAG11_NODE_6952_length_1220_cov_1.404996_1_plen_99_part_10